MALAVLQTPGPAGPEELDVVVPVLVSAAWFAAGVLAVVLVGWVLLVPAVARVVRRRNRNNPTLQEAISRYVKLLVLLVGVLVGATLAGYGTWLADSAIVIAAATLALGVAAQSVIGSLVGGLVLVADPEFNVGDHIEWEGGRGVVTSITLRATRIRTPDDALVTVPNTVLTSQPVTRPYGRDRYRMVEQVGIAYADDVGEALHCLVEAAAGLERSLDDPAPEAFVEALDPDAVVLRVHYWLENPRHRELFGVRSRFARAAKAALEAAGITISPPSQRALLGRIAIEEESDPPRR